LCPDNTSSQNTPLAPLSFLFYRGFHRNYTGWKKTCCKTYKNIWRNKKITLFLRKLEAMKTTRIKNSIKKIATNVWRWLNEKNEEPKAPPAPAKLTYRKYERAKFPTDTVNTNPAPAKLTYRKYERAKFPTDVVHKTPIPAKSKPKRKVYAWTPLPPYGLTRIEMFYLGLDPEL
jgi:hypothetical protein